MNSVTGFAAKNYHHVLGATSVALVSHGLGLWGAFSARDLISNNIKTQSQQTMLRAGLVSTSFLATALAGWVSPSRLRVPVLLYTVAIIFPAIVWKYEREVIESEGKFFLGKVTNIISSITNLKINENNENNVNNEDEFLGIYGLALPIIGVVGLLLANIHIFKFTLPYIQKFSQPLMKGSANAYVGAKPHFPAAARVFAKLASGFAIGQGLGALFCRVLTKDVNRLNFEESKMIKRGSGMLAKLGFLAATVTLLTGSECLGKYKAILPIISSVGLGFTWLNVNSDYELRSSILPVKVSEKSRAFTLMGMGAAGLYLASNPLIVEMCKLIIKRA